MTNWGVRSAFWRRCGVEFRGHIHQVRQRASLHLSHHLAPVGFHGDLADAELTGDLFIQPSGDDQCHDLPLAVRERRVVVPQRPYLRFMTQCPLAALDGVADGVQQHVVAEWLGQELHGACLHGLHRHWHVTVARDEDDWHVGPVDGDKLLQIETTKAGKRNVKYEAARNTHTRAGKELLCRREYRRLPTRTADQ